VSARTQRRSVIAAFPATGKTYIAGRDHRFADSDSSGFSWESPGVRNPEWPANYMAHIKGLIADGRHVLCSTHQEVRDALVDAGLPFTLVYPAEDQRDEYIRRMTARGSAPRLIDFVAGRWDELIAGCRAQDRCDHVVLTEGRYLLDVLGRAVSS
jgi:hypothetical protein